MSDRTAQAARPLPPTVLSAAVAAVALYLTEERAESGPRPSRWQAAARREAVAPFDRHAAGAWPGDR